MNKVVVQLRKSAPYICGVAVMSIALFGQSYSDEVEPAGGCFGEPGSPSPPPPCDVRPDSCEPMNEPPTSWEDYCCVDLAGPGYGCRQVWYRHQCCTQTGRPNHWGLAWKKIELTGIQFTCFQGDCIGS